MKAPVEPYIKAYRNLLWYFNCRGDYPLRPLPGVKWLIRREEDAFFLCVVSSENPARRETYVIASAEGEPLLYEAADSTLIVAIDCVKTAFILDNTLRS